MVYIYGSIEVVSIVTILKMCWVLHSYQWYSVSVFMTSTVPLRGLGEILGMGMCSVWFWLAEFFSGQRKSHYSCWLPQKKNKSHPVVK